MKRLNFAPYDGLRGVLALYIMLHHCLLLSDVAIDIQGWCVMPVFYILSGFMIHYVERMKQPKDPNSREAELRLLEQQPDALEAPTTEAEVILDHNTAKFNILHFYVSRAARFLPTYYFSLLLSLPLWLLGYGARNPAHLFGLLGPVLTSVIPTVSWVNIPLGMGGCLNAPAWTISTMCFFWFIIYPYAQRQAEFKENKQLVGSIARIFWINGLGCVIGLVVLTRFLSFEFAFEIVFTMPTFRSALFEAGTYSV